MSTAAAYREARDTLADAQAAYWVSRDTKTFLAAAAALATIAAAEAARVAAEVARSAADAEADWRAALVAYEAAWAASGRGGVAYDVYDASTPQETP